MDNRGSLQEEYGEQVTEPKIPSWMLRGRASAFGTGGREDRTCEVDWSPVDRGPFRSSIPHRPSPLRWGVGQGDVGAGPHLDSPKSSLPVVLFVLFNQKRCVKVQENVGDGLSSSDGRPPPARMGGENYGLYREDCRSCEHMGLERWVQGEGEILKVRYFVIFQWLMLFVWL